MRPPRASLIERLGRLRSRPADRGGVLLSDASKMVVALLITTVGGAVVGYLVVQMFFLPETVALAQLNRIPDLTGLSTEAAGAEGERFGYPVTSAGAQFSAAVDSGRVVYQSPPPDAYLARGDTLWILLSLGAGQPRVPDVEGLQLDLARSILERSGLGSVATREEASELHAEGVVIATVPPAAADFSRGDPVTIVVSGGGSSFAMPDVRGLTLAAARDSLEVRGLVVGEITGLEDGRGLAGQASVVVSRQRPSPGSRVRLGLAVAITLGEAAFRLPSVLPSPPGETPRNEEVQR